MINFGESAFTSSDIIVDIRDVKSIVSLGGDDLGEENKDGNVLKLSKYYDKKTGQWVNQERALTLPGDAFRDRTFLDWIISDKSEKDNLLMISKIL